MKRIYHPYTLWEDIRRGFYDNCSGADKKEKIEKVIEMFSSPELTREFIMLDINKGSYSCEHELTNESMNKIAYLGQAACCLYSDIPSTVTMESWSKLTTEVQEEANKIANEVLEIWIDRNKNIQLCLNII